MSVYTKKLEYKINELTVKNNSLEAELKNTKSELDWVMDQYNVLMNATFSELFDLSAKVKSKALYKILEIRNKELSE